MIFDDFYDSGEEVAALVDLGNSVPSLSFNRDGSRLAAADGDGRAMVWETEGWTIVDPELGEDNAAVMSLRYSPYDDVLVTIDAGGNLAIRDAMTHEIEKELIGGGSPNILDGLFFFADDRRYLVTAADSEARLWDLEAGLSIGDPFPNDANNRVNGADGRPRFATAVGNWRLVWDLDISTWRDAACRAAGRNLTREEWDEFGPSGPYQSTCAEYPEAPERGSIEPGFEPRVRFDPVLEALGVEARDELIDLIEAGDSNVVVTCAEWENRLTEAASGLSGGVVRSGELRLVLRASERCAAGLFDKAFVDLTTARDGTNCGPGYSGPCVLDG